MRIWTRSSREIQKRIDDKRNKEVKELGEDADIQAKVQVIQKRKSRREAREAEDETAVRKIFTRAQLVRLQEISYQAEGASLFERPEIQEKLLLVPEDVQRIQEILAESNRQINQADRIPPDVIAVETKRLAAKEKKPSEKEPQEKAAPARSKDFQKAYKNYQSNLADIRKQTMGRIAKALTKGQRARYEKLVGEPFDFSKTWGKPVPLPPRVTDEPAAKETQPAARK